MHPSDFEPFTGIGFELWAVNRELAFSNVLIAHDEQAVKQWNKDNFLVRQRYQRQNAERGELEEESRSGFYPKLIESFSRLKDSFQRIYRESPLATILLLILPFVFYGIIHFCSVSR